MEVGYIIRSVIKIRISWHNINEKFPGGVFMDIEQDKPLYGAAWEQRFIKQQGGLKTLLLSTYQAGFIAGEKSGFAKALLYVDELYKKELNQKIKIVWI